MFIKKIFQLTILLLSCMSLMAQKDVEKNQDEVKNAVVFFDTKPIKDLLHPEYKLGTVVLFGGSQLNGYIHLKDNSDIKFKKDIDSNEKILYYSRSIKSITFEDEVLEYKTVSNRPSAGRMALKIEIEGDVMLYSDSFFRYMVDGGRTKKEEVHYYLGKKDDTEVLHIGFPNSYSKKFRKVTEDYFGSCEALFDKTENREFERSDIHAIVNFYNTECTKTIIDE